MTNHEAKVTVEADPKRPGAWFLTVERRRRTHRLWLSAYEAAQVYRQLGAALPPVTTTRRES